MSNINRLLERTDKINVTVCECDIFQLIANEPCVSRQLLVLKGHNIKNIDRALENCYPDLKICRIVSKKQKTFDHTFNVYNAYLESLENTTEEETN